jgi:hypothetical protein
LDSKSNRVSGIPISGCLAVAFLLATTRWGSYIHAGPVYLTDLLFFAALSHFIVGLHTRRRLIAATGIRFEAPASLVFFILWVILRWISSGDLSMVALRDSAPYMYALFAVLAGYSMLASDTYGRLATSRILIFALRLHAAWFFVVQVVWPALPASLPALDPSQTVHLFSVRNDVDTALAGVYAAWLLRDVINGKKYAFFSACLMGLIWGAIFQTGSRAGMGGAVIPFVAMLISLIRRRGLINGPRAMLMAFSPVVFTAALVSLPATSIGQRFITTFTGHASSGGVNAQGTANARFQAWDILFQYSAEGVSRFVTGVGFGPDFMHNSGAIYALVGEGDGGTTRSPHSFWVGTLIRLGVIGLIAFGILLIVVLRVAANGPSLSEAEPLYVLNILVVVALIAPFSLGVVLESPFGAVPFYWACGVILGYRQLGVQGLRRAQAPLYPARLSEGAVSASR